MLEDRVTRWALVLSILLHSALIAPVWGWWTAPSGAPAETKKEREPLEFRFVDAQPAPEQKPQEPTPNVSSTDSRATQPEAPEALPEGEAYATGRSPVPTTPRDAGAPAGAPSDEAPEAAERKPAEREPAERKPAESRRPDPRLTEPMKPMLARPERAAPPGDSRLPVPEVDNRLTRATAGSSFALNTTAWEFGPYMERLKRAIERHIHPPAAFYYGTAAWVTRVRFRIEPDGSLSVFELVDHQGVANLQYVATDAIQGAADFEPLPTDFPEEHLEVVGNFYFNVVPGR